MAKAKAEKRDYAQEVAERVIEQLREGTAPWQKPWTPGESYMPYNPTSGKQYRGMNSMWLMMQGRSDPRWMTYRQADGVGAQVRKGEKGTLVQYWMFREDRPVTGSDGKPVLDEQGRPLKTSVELERPKVISSVVFNAEQIDGLPEREIRPVPQEFERHERAEKMLAASPAAIQHIEGDRAYYSLRDDRITLPLREQFATPDGYYATALHEIGHSTGHADRLARDLSHPFGSEGYAKEELRAEIASLMLGEELGIGHDPGQHASYVGSWIKALENDPREIFRAASDAEKILQFMVALERQQELERAPVQEAATGRVPLPDLSYEQAIERGWAEAVALGHGLSEDDAQEAQRLLGASRLADWFHDYSDDGAASRRGAEAIDRLKADAAHFAGRSPLHANLMSAIADATHREGASLTAGSWHVLAPFRPDVLALIGHDAPKVIAFADGLGDERPFSDRLAAAYTFHRGALPKDFALSPDAESIGFVRRGELAAAHERNQEERRAEERYADEQRAELAYQRENPGSQGMARFLEEQADRQGDATWDRDDDLTPPQSPQVENAANRGADREQTADRSSSMKSESRINLTVPYAEKDAAKAAGARWDKAAKTWYAPPGADLAALNRWTSPASARAELDSDRAVAAREEFGDALRAAGLLLGKGELPVMDGQWHRVLVDGDNPKGKERSGSYKGHLDGRPAGVINNFRDPQFDNVRWTSSRVVPSISPEQRAEQLQRAEARKVARAAELLAEHKAVAAVIIERLGVSQDAPADHPYLARKGVGSHGVKVMAGEPMLVPPGAQEPMRFGHEGALLVPLRDIDGTIWGAQAIGPGSRKSFARGGKLAGCFHMLGSPDGAKGILVAEGYATAATLHEVTGLPVAVAFNAGNLLPVADALMRRYPEQSLMIAGDNDVKREQEGKANVGREKAEAVAQKLGAVALLPQFKEGERGSDWNDLALLHGASVVKDQLRDAFAIARRKVLANEIRQDRQREQQQSHAVGRTHAQAQSREREPVLTR